MSTDDDHKSHPTTANVIPIMISSLELPQSVSSASSKKPASTKYRHVAAVHYKPKTSCLSHDSDASPSFLGFRNLMVLVLGE